jgi:hypothetical protein
LGQMSASAAVHCPQNFIPPGFSKPHFEQRIVMSAFELARTVQTKLVSVGFAKVRFGPPVQIKGQQFL